MKHKLIIFTCLMMISGLISAPESFGRLKSGDKAPVFSATDINGKNFDLEKLAKSPMTILYFFDAQSKSSREGIVILDKLGKKYKDTDMAVWAITTSPRQKALAFANKTGISFPVITDAGDISDKYNARLILPTIYILGPSLKIMDYFQGGGKSTEIMLVRLAERNLQRKKIDIAKAITREVVKKNPGNTGAKVVQAYAAIESGKLDEARKISDDLKKAKGEGEILASEVKATIYAKKGETQKALAVANEITQKAPQRAYAHKIKADMLYAQNKKKAAAAEYEKAASAKKGNLIQKAAVKNKVGRFYASMGQYKKARSLYDKAIEIDPYSIEATSNKGITYEKQGKWGKALDSYRSALSLNKNDIFAKVLAQKAQEMLEIGKDAQRSARIGKLVKELAQRFRKNKAAGKKIEDTWTSRPMILSFIDFQEKGLLSDRDGFASVIAIQLADKLNASGRVKVVERVLLEKLLDELNLGSSELADPDTALRLGKVLAARLIGTGSLYYLPDGTLFNMRLIDTETTAVPKVMTKHLSQGQSLEKTLDNLNREILKAVIAKYPLKGYIVQADGDEVIINLGEKQGVVLGTKFQILGAPKIIKYKGKTLKGSPKPIGEIEITKVEPDFCYGKITSKKQMPGKDDKVIEKITKIALSRG